MNFNTKLFFKINQLIGKNRLLDAFGMAGAEWVIVAMIGWYVAGVYLDRFGSGKSLIWAILMLPLGWLVGWLMNVIIGLLVKEPRPHVTYKDSKLLIQPKMHWKSFPSDHAMSAWLIVFLGLLFNVPGVEALMLMALWVGWGRVYVGVHYPFDIVGGMAVAGLVAMLGLHALMLFY